MLDYYSCYICNFPIDYEDSKNSNSARFYTPNLRRLGQERYAESQFICFSCLDKLSLAAGVKFETEYNYNSGTTVCRSLLFKPEIPSGNGNDLLMYLAFATWLSRFRFERTPLDIVDFRRSIQLSFTQDWRRLKCTGLAGDNSNFSWLDLDFNEFAERMFPVLPSKKSDRLVKGALLHHYATSLWPSWAKNPIRKTCTSAFNLIMTTNPDGSRDELESQIAFQSSRSVRVYDVVEEFEVDVDLLVENYASVKQIQTAFSYGHYVRNSMRFESNGMLSVYGNVGMRNLSSSVGFPRYEGQDG